VRNTSVYVFLCTNVFVNYFLNQHVYTVAGKKNLFVLWRIGLFRKIPAAKLLPFQELSFVMGLSKESCLLHVECSIYIYSRACVRVCVQVCVSVYAR